MTIKEFFLHVIALFYGSRLRHYFYMPYGERYKCVICGRVGDLDTKYLKKLLDEIYQENKL